MWTSLARTPTPTHHASSARCRREHPFGCGLIDRVQCGRDRLTDRLSDGLVIGEQGHTDVRAVRDDAVVGPPDSAEEHHHRVVAPPPKR